MSPPLVGLYFQAAPTKSSQHIKNGTSTSITGWAWSCPNFFFYF
jgi:hypothetical protein